MVAMVRWDNAWNYTLASERPGNAGSCDGSCWKLLLIDQDYGQERAPLQRGVGGQRTLHGNFACHSSQGSPVRSSWEGVCPTGLLRLCWTTSVPLPEA